MDLNNNGENDFTELLTGIIYAISPLILLTISVGCITVTLQMDDLEDKTKGMLSDTRNVSFSSALALLNSGKKREKNG